MAINRLSSHFAVGNGANSQQPPEMKGFAAVPVKGIPGWSEVAGENRALYEFAYLLAQAQCKENEPIVGLPGSDDFAGAD